MCGPPCHARFCARGSHRHRRSRTPHDPVSSSPAPQRHMMSTALSGARGRRRVYGASHARRVGCVPPVSLSWRTRGGGTRRDCPSRVPHAATGLCCSAPCIVIPSPYEPGALWGRGSVQRRFIPHGGSRGIKRSSFSARGAEERTKRQPDTLRSRETGLECVCLGGHVSGGNFPDKPPSDPADGVLSGKNSS